MLSTPGKNGVVAAVSMINDPDRLVGYIVAPYPIVALSGETHLIACADNALAAVKCCPSRHLKACCYLAACGVINSVPALPRPAVILTGHLRYLQCARREVGVTVCASSVKA